MMGFYQILFNLGENQGILVNKKACHPRVKHEDDNLVARG